MFPSIVQQEENGKTMKGEYNLPHQECIYEVQEKGAFFCLFGLDFGFVFVCLF